MSTRRRQEMSLGVTYGALWEHPQDVTLRRPQDVIFQRSKDVSRESSQECAEDVPCRYKEDHMGMSIGCLLGMSSGRPRDVILPSAMHMK